MTEATRTRDDGQAGSGYPACVISHRIPRAALRAAAVGTALALPLLASPAFADTPADWPKAPHVSGLDFLIVLVLIPAGLAILITLLVMLPSLIKGDAYEPGKAWVGQNEWFGGPGKGVDAVKGEEPPSTSGGASADF